MAPQVGVVAQQQAPLTVAETLVPSVLTSALLFVAVGFNAPSFADTPTVQLAFFALLPTLLSLACVQDKLLQQPFKRVFMLAFQCGDPLADGAEQSAVAKAITSARIELARALLDRWQMRKSLAPTASSPALAALHHHTPSRQQHRRQHQQHQRREVATSSSSVSSELLSASTSGKSLYEQVKENLTDHAFTKRADAPIYLMDPATGLFLQVNAQHKLVFTSAPDAACLFHVTRGKTHHWGFLSAIYQRYVGQNFVGRVVVSSKKLQSWESFRVLQRPDSASASDSVSTGDNGSSGTGTGGTSKTIYMILCSSRFGKGMWLAKNQRASLSASVGPSTAAARAAADSTSSSSSARDSIYLSKSFAHALALTYASDLSAFEYLADDRYTTGTRSVHTDRTAATTLTQRTALSAPLPIALGTVFQPPVLAESAAITTATTTTRTHVALPWLDDASASLSSATASSKRFTELADRQMTEVIATTITRCTVREFLDLVAPDSTLAVTAAAPAAVPASDGATAAKQSKQWHSHPHFGLVRKLSYRPSAVLAAAAAGASESNASVPSLRTIAIDAYDACALNDKTAMDHATLRSKIFTLSAPFSNCCSVETVFEVQDLADTTTGGPSPVNLPVLQIRCLAGVRFTRVTSHAAVVETGALEGVRRTCDLVLEALRDRRGSSAAAAAAATTSSSASSSLPPHALAIEVVRGMISAFQDAAGLSSRIVASLPTRLPWRVYVPAALESDKGASSPPTAVAVAPTAVPFFESTPQQFALALDEALGSKVTPALLFDSLLADACAFRYRQNGNENVDIGAWVPYPIGAAAGAVTSETFSSRVGVGVGSSDSDARAWVRLQTFRMPLDGLAGVAHVQDFQYHAFVHDERTGKRRLEFGAKLIVKDLPEGEHYSCETLVHVEMNDGAPSSILRVFYAIPDARTRRRSSGGGASGASLSQSPSSAALATVENGVRLGLRAIWKHVALTMVDASQPTSSLRLFQSYQDLGAAEIQQRLQSEGKLPTHDELSSKLVAAIATAFE